MAVGTDGAGARGCERHKFLIILHPIIARGSKLYEATAIANLVALMVSLVRLHILSRFHQFHLPVGRQEVAIMGYPVRLALLFLSRWSHVLRFGLVLAEAHLLSSPNRMRARFCITLYLICIRLGVVSSLLYPLLIIPLIIRFIWLSI